MLKHFFLLMMIMIIFTGCAGSDKGETSGNDKGGTPEDDHNGGKYISGGTIDNPVYLKLGSRNEIKNNYFHNYFKYNAYKGEKLILHANLDQDFQSADWNGCSSGSSDLNFIRVYDNSLNLIKTSHKCFLDLTIEFPFSGMYILYFNYSNHNGYVEAASVSAEWLASLPKLNLATKNEMFSNTFKNYYVYEAYANEKLMLHANLDQGFQSVDWNRCTSDSDLNFIRIYDEELNVIKTSKKCHLDLVVDFPISKKYIVHFNYPKHSGYAEARTIN